ncbi:MAG: hypothetical protein VW268_07400 [Rhodospirillaceae bacterium]
MTAKLDPFDLVISDIRKPHMHGGALLKRLAERYLETRRIAFSDKYDALATYAITDCSHSCLAKPYTSGELYHFVEHAYETQKAMLDHAECALI